MISSPPLRYFGSKWRIAEWIIATFPSHRTYCEPYCGGANVFFRKPPSVYEVLNDLDGEVINFFQMLRTREAELIRAIDLTPYSREEWRLSRIDDGCTDPLERARRFYISSRQSFGPGSRKRQPGWRFANGKHIDNKERSVTREWSNLDHLLAAAHRLKAAMIECDDALKVVERFDTPRTLFYVDPPYVHATRYSRDVPNDYTHEMTDADHERLAEVLHNVSGYVVISGYRSDLYQRLYPDWKRLEKAARSNYNGTHGNSGDANRVECLWLSPRVTSVDALPLFAMRGGVRR